MNPTRSPRRQVELFQDSPVAVAVDEGQLGVLDAVPRHGADAVPPGRRLGEGRLPRPRVPDQDAALGGPRGQEGPVPGPGGHAHELLGDQVVAGEFGFEVPGVSGEYLTTRIR